MRAAAARRSGVVRRPPGGLLFVVALALLALVIVLSFGIGPLRIPPGDVVHVIAHKLGLVDAGALSQRDISVVWNLRVPRALLAVLVGASLAMAGAGLQGLFGNPLADPGIVGVTHGAALGAVAAIVLGATALGAWTIPVAAFAGGALTTTLIYLLARPDRGSGTATLLLVGIAIAAGCSAAIGFFTYIADASELQSLVFWQMGSLAMADWRDLLAALPAFAVGAALLSTLARPLDMLALGERQAQHIGLDVRRTRVMLVAVCALLVGSAVAFAGVVGFVGLVVPHFVRLLAGPGHRWLLPLSAVVGGLLVVVADTAARSLDPPSEIPLGLFSAALGAPFFLWLVLRRRHRSAL
ncbi:iron ABC transporter permease [Luteimonas sp. BDR2-5]|uniref:FecCD family ABC transporter permease n=1 Tax=Proluteimonas luteida TaxID=2878685 RepID=UPI001E36A859|nr:iron ABC transporter permease [Luteimonas sp. BDR2-5]MCD9028292.1 iron ABC transporter permease [Luteimonas sp. BDR2-5]